MQKNKEIKISFGELAQSLSAQLKNQGFKYDKHTVEHFEKLRECISYISLNQLVKPSEIQVARKRLFKRIKDHVKMVSLSHEKEKRIPPHEA